MMDTSRLPDQPLAFIRDCVINGRVLWTYHVNMRMKGRFISREMIVGSLEEYEIIESYPDDKYLPSYLVYSRHDDIIFHVLFGVDVEGNNARVVTAYIPDPELWADDMKRRKKP